MEGIDEDPEENIAVFLHEDVPGSVFGGGNGVENDVIESGHLEDSVLDNNEVP